MVRTLEHHRKIFAKAYIETGNATEAVRIAHPELAEKSSDDYLRRKAHRLITNDHIITEIDRQRESIERAAGKAAKRMHDLVKSEDEAIALNTSKWLLEQVHGKAMQKNFNLNVNMDLESALSDL